MINMDVSSFAAGQWRGPDQTSRPIFSAVTGETIARAGCKDLPLTKMLDYAKSVGGPALRDMTFHDRAWALKNLAIYLNERKQDLYALSPLSGATFADSFIDIDGGISTLFVFSSKGRREMPDAHTFIDGQVEQLSRHGTFVGQHIYVPKLGVGVHINAFNFPVWGMLEKLAPTILAGMPAIIKPATSTCYLTEACFRMIVESEILPQGSVQLIAGGVGNLLNLLSAQDVVSFTGSASTAFQLRSAPHLIKNSIPFIAEQDSLNATVLGEDAEEGSEEFDIFVQEICKEMTTKAGQKCTAIRRILVPEKMQKPVIDAVTAGLAEIKIGDPADKMTQMGALVSKQQKHDVEAVVSTLMQECALVSSGYSLENVDAINGAFMAPQLLHCSDPIEASDIHKVEAFGPVSTIIPYQNMAEAVALVNKGEGSLVVSLFSHDTHLAQQFAGAVAPWHGRIYINNRDSAKESTGHGAPLPHMVHGGPGRAGGGEELGGIRGVMHYMQRTAVQGSPDMIAAISETYVPNSRQKIKAEHPFTKTFLELEVGETLVSPLRIVTLDDINHFAEFTGDQFYAHTNEEAASANPFFSGRVAHGYLLLSFAAGLFVEPNPGPVLANTGLDNLRFEKPVMPGDSIKVSLTVKRKTKRNDEYGEVRWFVRLSNQHDDQVATYELLTMVSFESRL